MRCWKESENLMQILLANPRGFCAGVDRAIDIVERAVTLFGAPIYVRHEVVHNKYVVDRLRTIGAVFVEELNEVPDGATVIFSAHGVPRAVQQEAKHRSLNVFDATCPLVTKVHMEITRYAREAREVFLIGHAGHPEVEGTIGQFDVSLGGSIYLVQTVEDVAALCVQAARAPGVAGKMYNGGNGGRYTLNFIWRLLEKMEGVEIPPAYGPPRAGDVRHSMADTEAAAAELGHAPRFGIEEGLKRTLEWYRATAADQAA